MSAVLTERYHVHFVKNGYCPPEGSHFLSNFRPVFLKSPSASTGKKPQSVLKEVYSDISPAQED